MKSLILVCNTKYNLHQGFVKDYKVKDKRLQVQSLD
jgi:hypothetical protein